MSKLDELVNATNKGGTTRYYLHPEAQAELAALRAKLVDVEKEYNELHTLFVGINKENESRRAELAALRAEVERLRAELERQEAENDNLIVSLERLTMFDE